jgi:hypothetical protein
MDPAKLAFRGKSDDFLGHGDGLCPIRTLGVDAPLEFSHAGATPGPRTQPAQLGQGGLSVAQQEPTFGGVVVKAVRVR